MLDHPSDPAAEPNERAVVRTIALAVVGVVIGAVLAILGVTTLMSIYGGRSCGTDHVRSRPSMTVAVRPGVVLLIALWLLGCRPTAASPVGQGTGQPAIDNPSDPISPQPSQGYGALSDGLLITGPGLAGGPLEVRFAIDGGVASNVTATTVDPSGTTRVFALTDYGGPLDGGSGDGVFGQFLWGTRDPGTYTVDVVATVTDGAGNASERRATDTVTLGPFTDTDGDGVADVGETFFRLDPTDPGDGSGDLDFDGLTVAAELDAGTLPVTGDSDGGGEGDGSELAAGRNPTLAGDDRAFPVVGLRAIPADANRVTVVIGTIDGTQSVALERVSPSGEVEDLGIRPGSPVTFSDGPLAAGDYRYVAWAIDSTGARSAPTMVGPVSPGV